MYTYLTLSFPDTFRMLLVCSSCLGSWSRTFSKSKIPLLLFFVESLSHFWLFETPWTAVPQASLSFTISQSLVRVMFIELVMPSNHLILCRPLLLLPSIFPSFRLFSNKSLHQVAKVLEIQLQHQSFQWLFKVDFLWMDWFDLLAVKRTLKSLLQHHN